MLDDKFMSLLKNTSDWKTYIILIMKNPAYVVFVLHTKRGS